MTFLNDKRAVSEVLGAILVFGILIAALGIYQAFIVPQANQQAEFSHNQELQSQLLDLRSSIHSVERTGSAQSVSIDLAADYSNRIIAINPPTPIGTLRTQESGDLTLSNIRALDSEEQDYWNFPGDSTKVFSTKYLEFTPRYNLYRNAPRTVIDHSVVYHIFEDSEIAATNQRLIQGNRISLGVLAGDRTYSDREANIELTPISTGTTTVPVEAANDDDPLKISIPTQLSRETWEELLDDQITNGHVSGFEVESGVLTIELEPGVTYNLQMAKVGVGPDFEGEDPHYVVRAGGDEKAIEQGQQADLTAEVRDQFNNPVSGAEVTFEIISGDASIVEEDGRTDENGHATVTVEAEKNNQTIEVEASIDDGNPDMERVTFRLVVGHAEPGEFGARLNPATGIIFADAYGDLGQSKGEEIEVRFRNTLDSGTLEFEQLRVNVYVPQTPGASHEELFPTTMVVIDSDGNVEQFELRDDYRGIGDLDMNFSTGESKTYTFKFGVGEYDEGTDSFEEGEFNVMNGDYFIMSAIFDDDTSSIYVIAPRDDDPPEGEFAFVDASDVSIDTSDQQVSFGLPVDSQEGDEVLIDFGDAQHNQNALDYQGASLDHSGSGILSVATANNNQYELRYEVGPDEAGSSILIDIDGIDTENVEVGDEFTVAFDLSEGGDDSDTFEIVE